MLQKLRIGPRLIVLLAVQAVMLAIIGGSALLGLNHAARSTEQLNSNVSEGTLLSYMAETIREDLLASVRGLEDEVLEWDEVGQRLADARRTLNSDWQAFTAGLDADEAEFVGDVLAPGLEDVREAITRLAAIVQGRDRAALGAYADEIVPELVQPFLNSVLASASERQIASRATFESAIARNRVFLIVCLAVIVVGVAVAAVLGTLMYRSIVRPIDQMAETVNEVARGNYGVRTGLSGNDELALLGGALDELLEDKVASLARTEHENEQLNESVIRLLEAVARMSERDLTVMVPVSPDVTGPVADAINQMAEETSKVLKQVSRIAAKVGQVCQAVNTKAMTVNEVADAQRAEAERTAAELADAAEALAAIARTARECSDQAGITSESTRTAMDAMHGTLDGMKVIREAIQETGKRIKRLGERSQEITGIVDIINTIAERTHVLALNASMQAASAGDAGRGFAVVAEEVQRLAESSRDATRQISGLVKNIQVDTNDTIVTMDMTIGQVVEGTRLAESAERQMAGNRDATGRLVEAVQQIAARSDDQARISAELRERAGGMLKRTRGTAAELAGQLEQTRNLVRYAKMLIQSVRVFKLPAEPAAR